MYKLCSGLFFAVVFFILVLIFPSDSHAQSCSGVYYCAGFVRYCTYPGTGLPGCDEFAQTCNCSDIATGGPGEPNYCDSIGDAGTCSFVNSYACSETPFGRWSGSCSWNPGGGGGGGGGSSPTPIPVVNQCTVDSQCGSNSRCCGAGTGNYCSNSCYDCAGNYICAPPCPENQSGANDVQCQSNSCVSGWSPIGGYACSASNGVCCGKNAPTPVVCPYPNGVSNYTTYCSGNTIRESYDRNDSVCGHSDNLLTTCSDACISSPTPHCPSAPAPNTPTTAACRTVGLSCGTGCCSGLTCSVATNTCVTSVTSTPVVTPTSPPTGGACGSVCDGSYGSCSEGTCTQQGSGQPSICVCGGGGGGTCVDNGGACFNGVAGFECCYPNSCNSGTCGVPPPTTYIRNIYAFINENKGNVVTNPRLGSPDNLCPSTYTTTTQCSNAGYNKCTGGPFTYYTYATVSSTGVVSYSDTQKRTGLCYDENNGNTTFDNDDFTRLSGARIRDIESDNMQLTNTSGRADFTYYSTPIGTKSYFLTVPTNYRTTAANPASISADDQIFTISLAPSCASLTRNARSGNGGLPAAGEINAGQDINLFANIINDDNNRTNAIWSSTCGSFPVKNWDYSTFRAPTTNNTGCTITYSLYGQIQPACTSTIIVSSATITGKAVRANGTTLAPPPTGVIASIEGPFEDRSTLQNSDVNPWSFSAIKKGTYTITSSLATGYSTSYKCTGGDCPSTGPGDPTLDPTLWYASNKTTKRLPSGGDSLDITFRYSPAPIPPSPCNLPMAGDVDNDGFVTTLDAGKINTYANLGTPLPTWMPERADVNDDGVIDDSDALMVSNYANDGGTTVFPACSGTPAPVCVGTQAISGNVRVDTAGNNCIVGSTGLAGVPVSFNRSEGSPVTLSTTTAAPNGLYSFSGPLACTGTRTITIQPAVTYSVTGLQINGVWQNYSSYTSPAISTVTPQTLSWCISTNAAWYRTNNGDVRYPSLVNKVPAGTSASLDANNPSIFFSSDNPLTGSFGLGTSSPKNWQVADEYSYNDDFVNGLGTMSYSFYNSQKKKKGIAVIGSMGTPNSLAAKNSGIYTRTGDLTLTASSIPNTVSNRHVIMLVSGNVTITGDITVAPNQGNLFILAAGGKIDIASNVTNLDGYYTAEGNINILHNTTITCPTADVALTVSGGLIANALRPFAVGGTGQVVNGRTLCAGNATTPSLIVNSRFEFLTQLTDFYKTTNKTYKEVNP